MMLHSNAPPGSRTYDLSITSPKPYHYTEPPTHSTLTLKQISVYNELRTCVWLWKQTQRLISIQNYNTAHNPTKITKICTKIAKFYTNKNSEGVIKLYIIVVGWAVDRRIPLVFVRTWQLKVLSWSASCSIVVTRGRDHQTRVLQLLLTGFAVRRCWVLGRLPSNCWQPPFDETFLHLHRSVASSLNVAGSISVTSSGCFRTFTDTDTDSVFSLWAFAAWKFANSRAFGI